MAGFGKGKKGKGAQSGGEFLGLGQYMTHMTIVANWPSKFCFAGLCWPHVAWPIIHLYSFHSAGKGKEWGP